MNKIECYDSHGVKSIIPGTRVVSVKIIPRRDYIESNSLPRNCTFFLKGQEPPRKYPWPIQKREKVKENSYRFETFVVEEGIYHTYLISASDLYKRIKYMDKYDECANFWRRHLLCYPLSSKTIGYSDTSDCIYRKPFVAIEITTGEVFYRIFENNMEAEEFANGVIPS